MPTHDSKAIKNHASQTPQSQTAIKKVTAPQKKNQKGSRSDIDMTQGATESFGIFDRKTYKYGTQTYDLEEAQEQKAGEWVDPVEKEVSKLSAKQDQPRTVMDPKVAGHYRITQPYITLNGEDKPSPEQLYSKDEDGNGLLVDHQQGSIESPITSNELLPQTLFIDNTTHAEDVRQGNIGDCYFLSAVLQIVNQQPRKFLDIMKISGDTVTTTLYRKEGGEWVPTTIQTKYGVATRTNQDTGEVENMGSTFRIAYRPKTSKWHAEIEENSRTLKVNRQSYYEAALWVNCLEQAFAAFAQKYGKYGTGYLDPFRRSGLRGERYDTTIDRGYARQCVTMFYGNDVQENTKHETSTYVDKNAGKHTKAETNEILIKKNKNVLQDLQTFAQAQDGQGDHLVFCSAGIMEKEAISRMELQAKATEQELAAYMDKTPANSRNINKMQHARAMLQEVNSLIRGYRSKPMTEQTQIRKRLHEITIDFSENDSIKVAGLKSLENLMRSMASIINNINGRKNLFILTTHAYNISNVVFKNSADQNINGLPYDEIKTQLDLDKSTITMQNPHGTNKASYPNNYAEQKEGGEFPISLRAFLNNVDDLEFVKVNNTQRPV